MTDSLEKSFQNNKSVVWIVSQVFLANFQFRHFFR
jgi:hypothetical protein